jgi:hypothetical protein
MFTCVCVRVIVCLCVYVCTYSSPCPGIASDDAIRPAVYDINSALCVGVCV